MTQPRLSDEMRFIRSWLAKPLSIGAVAPSGGALARTMAGYVDPAGTAPVIELGPGTGPITKALVDHGVDPARLILLEYDPEFCAMLRQRYPTATVVQGDAYAIGKELKGVLATPAAAVVSGLPLLNQPPEMRQRLIREAFTLMAPGAPFVQFTYGPKSPIPPDFEGLSATPSHRIWMNVPPARVWVYRKAQP